MSIKGKRGILTAYVHKNITLIMDLGDPSLAGGQHPLKVEGNLVEPKDSEHKDEYSLLVSDWNASVRFIAREAMVKFHLDEDGEVYDITITVLPQEVF